MDSRRDAKTGDRRNDHQQPERCIEIGQRVDDEVAKRSMDQIQRIRDVAQKQERRPDRPREMAIHKQVEHGDER